MDVIAIWEELNRMNGTDLNLPEELLNLNSIEDYSVNVDHELFMGRTLDNAMQSN